MKHTNIRFLNTGTKEVISNPGQETLEGIYEQLDTGSNFKINIPPVGAIFRNLQTLSPAIGIIMCVDGEDFSTLGKQIDTSSPDDNLFRLKDRQEVLSRWSQFTFQVTRFLTDGTNSCMIELKELDKDPIYVYLLLPDDFENRFLFSLRGIPVH
jgi:hypothetical protein